MCRNIRTLFNFDPPVTAEEIRAASLQFVRKISGFNKPSKANEGSFLAAVEGLTYCRNHLAVRLVSGTYGWFRHFYAVPAAQDVNGREIGAVRAVLSVLSMIEHRATHIGVATDHVVESFRNELYAGYKT